MIGIEGTLALLGEKVRRAQLLYPWPTDGSPVRTMLIALMEEVGELAKELLENGSAQRVREEALDVCVVAFRIVAGE